jgi:hypothetical protein
MDPRELKERLAKVVETKVEEPPKVLSAYPAGDWDAPIKIVGGTCWNRKVVVVDEDGLAAYGDLPLRVITPLYERRPDGHLGAVGE